MNKYDGKAGSLVHSKDENELRALMKKAQEGDGESYKILLIRIEKMLQSFVRKSVNPDFSEDVIQEVILAVHTKRNTFNSEQFFLPWFYAIARYKVIDYIRAKKRQEVLVYYPDGFEELITSESSGIIDVLTVDDLQGILLKLPEKQRKVIMSVKIDGLSIKEAAQKYSLSESDIKVTIHRATKTLKALFSGGPT